jgi:arsenate reductase
MPVKIYHNPRCSKSRATLALLQDNGIEPEVVEYLKAAPSKKEIKELLSMLEMEPRDLMRKGEAPYKDENLSDDSKTEAQLIEAMTRHPILIERPIVVANGKARIGRPPEQVLEIV